jgi:hypothetical protein
MVLDIDTPTLRSAASDMSDAADTVATTAASLGNLGGLFDASVQEGLDALTVAWGAALDVMAEDVGYLAGRTNDAADQYDTTDHGLASSFERRRPR